MGDGWSEVEGLAEVAQLVRAVERGEDVTMADGPAEPQPVAMARGAEPDLRVVAPDDPAEDPDTTALLRELSRLTTYRLRAV